MIRSAWKTIRQSSALAACAALALASQGCYVYSAFQSARTLDAGRVSVSPSISMVNFSEDETEDVATQFGVRGAVGLGNRLEIQSCYERIQPREVDGFEIDGYNYLDFGLKYGIVPDRVAVGMPVGFYYGENIDTDESWNLQPSLYVTVPANRILDVNFSTTGLIWLNDSEDDFLWAFNGGLGINPGGGPLRLLPEMGMLINPGEDGVVWHFGLGAAVEF